MGDGKAEEWYPSFSRLIAVTSHQKVLTKTDELLVLNQRVVWPLNLCPEQDEILGLNKAPGKETSVSVGRGKTRNRELLTTPAD
jgi:hypothetical protein